MMNSKLLSCAVALLVPWATTLAWAVCPLDQSVYRDAAQRGFTLEFSPSTSGLATDIATAQLRQTRRGAIFSFEVGHSSGYGTVYMVRTDAPGTREHNIHFFDRRMAVAAPDNAAWIFVSNLGPADWYDNQRQAQREPFLGDVMWRFLRCKIHAGTTKQKTIRP